MNDFVYILLVMILFATVVYTRFQPIVTKNRNYIVISYVVRGYNDEATHREFVVFDTTTFRFVKSSF